MRGHGGDHGRRGDARADRRLPRGAPGEGGDRGRDRGLRRGDARPRAAGAPDPSGCRRRRRDGWRRVAHLQHLHDSSLRRSRGRRGGREARQPRRQLDLRLRGRPRGPRREPRAVAGAHRAVDRRARVRLHVRPGAPSGDAPRRPGTEGARCADDLQRARAADEPRRRPCWSVRCLRARGRAHGRGRARRARGNACLRRARRKRD